VIIRIKREVKKKLQKFFVKKKQNISELKISPLSEVVQCSETTLRKKSAQPGQKKAAKDRYVRQQQNGTR